MNTSKLNLNRLWCIVLLSFTVCIMSIAQTKCIEAHVELISLEEGYRILDCQQDGDFYPRALHFEFFIKNNSEKKLLFGSNTQDYYRNWDFGNKMVGQFIIVNEADTIILFSRASILVIDSYEERSYGVSLSGLYNFENPVFRNFICNLPTEKHACLEHVYKYLEKSTFWYIPIIDENEIYIKKLKSGNGYRNQEIVYPKNPIEIKMKDDLVIIFGDFESYPESYGMYRGSKDSIIYRIE